MTIHENAAETEVSTYYTPFSDCSHVNIDSKQTCVHQIYKVGFTRNTLVTVLENKIHVRKMLFTTNSK